MVDAIADRWALLTIWPSRNIADLDEFEGSLFSSHVHFRYDLLLSANTLM